MLVLDFGRFVAVEHHLCATIVPRTIVLQFLKSCSGGELYCLGLPRLGSSRHEWRFGYDDRVGQRCIL